MPTPGRAWRRDWPVLTAVAGMFVFLPQLALLLLVPDLPDISTVTGTKPNDPSMPSLWGRRCRDGWAITACSYMAVVLAALYGQFALVALSVARGVLWLAAH